MDGLQITFGGGVPIYQALLTALMPAVVAAGAALLGVWLTNDTVAKHKKADDEARRLEREAVERTTAEREARDRALTGLEFVHHLERYALDSASCVDDARRVNWHDVVRVPSFATFSAWPAIIDWRLLGPKHAAWARNFEMKVELIKLGLAASWDDGDPMAYCDDLADQASMLGHDAWTTAEALRVYFELEPFRFEDRAWNFVDLLERTATDARRRQAEIVERLAAARSGGGANDV